MRRNRKGNEEKKKEEKERKEEGEKDGLSMGKAGFAGSLIFT